MPEPALASPWAPLRTALIVAVWLTTVIVGIPLETTQLRVPPLPGARVQLWAFPKSPKTRLPIK